MVAHRHSRLELVVFALAHFIQLGSEIVQFVQIDVFSQLVIQAVHIAVIVCNEPLLIGVSEIVLLSDADTVHGGLDFFRCGGELHPFAYQFTLIVFAEVRNERGEGIIPVIFICRHLAASLPLRPRMAETPFRGRLGGAFLLGGVQPIPEGGALFQLCPKNTVQVPI